MSRARRRLLILAVIVVAGLGVLWGVSRILLSGRRVSGMVASRLQAAYGAPVQVGDADIGLGSSALHGLKLYEPNASTNDMPWAEVKELDADVSLLKLLSGDASPHRLTLRGADVTLRFDASGQLETKLPKPTSEAGALPNIRLEQGKLSLLQAGRPPFEITGLDADLAVDGDHVKITGNAVDPYWGTWTLTGDFDQKTNAGGITLHTGHAHVTQDMLNRLPFVPAKTWQQVQIPGDGDTPVTCTLRLDPGSEKAHFTADLDPIIRRLRIPSIDLLAENVSGRVRIEDATIKLTDVKGAAAGGSIQTSSDMDFRTPGISRLHFDVHAADLDLQKLPRKWNVSPKLGGRLSGQADLLVVVKGGKTHTSGDGSGTVNQARFGLLPISKPVLIKLHADGQRFHFAPQMPDLGGKPSAGLPAAVLLALVGLQEPPAPEPPLPVRLATDLGTGATRAVQWLADRGAQGVERLNRALAPNPPRAAEDRNYLETDLALEDVDVDQLVKSFDMKAPFPLAGKVSFKVHAAIPLATTSDLKAYRVSGTASSRRLSVSGLTLEELQARVVYEEGVLRLEELRAYVPADPSALKPDGRRTGELAGTARLQAVPQGDLTARLTLTDIPLQQVVGFVPGNTARAGGFFSGTTDVRVAVSRLRDPAAWQGNGRLSASRLEAYGLVVQDFTADYRLASGKLTLTEARARVEDMPVSAHAELDLTGPYRYAASVDLRQGALDALNRLSPDVRPPVEVRGTASLDAKAEGTLTPLTYQVTGTGSFADVRVENLDVTSVRFRWAAEKDQLKISELRSSLYEGTLTGNATVPLRPTAGGSLDLRFQDVEVGELSRALPATPVRLDGKASGTLQGTISAAPSGRPREFTSKLDLQAPRLRVQGIPAQRLHGTVNYRGGTVGYQFEGETLGGKFELHGDVPPAGKKPAPAAGQGRLQIQGAQLGRLGEALGTPRALSPLRGRLDLELNFRHDGADRAPVGSGRITVSRLRWNQDVIAETLEGELVLTERELRLRNFSGALGRGLFRSQVLIDLHQINRSRAVLVLEQVELSRLLAPWPALADQVRGLVDVRLRGTLGRSWYGTGELAMTRGTLAGLDVSGWRLPLDWSFAPGTGNGQLDIRESTLQIASGRLTGQTSFTWGGGNRLEGSLRFNGIQLRTLAHQLADSSTVGEGLLAGRAEFSGTDVRSIDDVRGRIDASFQQAQAMQLPVFQQLTPLLGMGQSSSSTFQSGDLRARLAGGLLRIERLSFAGNLLQLFAEGTVTLQGRLNLEVTATTGQVGASAASLRLLRLRIPWTGPIPISLLANGTTYLSNHTVHLRVGGTLRTPIIQVEPLGLLTEEAFRFFINQAGIPLP